jgi:hypothetical protein
MADSARRVGPVLLNNRQGRAVAAAMQSTGQIELVDRGAYLRVRAAQVCRVVRRDIEQELGETFEFPGDLEAVMPSFCGRLTIHEDGAEWRGGG